VLFFARSVAAQIGTGVLTGTVTDANAQSAANPSAPAAAAAGASHVGAYVLLGAGAASIVVATVFGFLALSAKSSFDGNPTYDQADSVRGNDERRFVRGRRRSAQRWWQRWLSRYTRR
jgi:hypothetical protein